MTRNMPSALLAVSLMYSMAVGAQTQTAVDSQLPSVSLAPELARVLTDYEAAWQARDPKKVAMLFAEDGFVLSIGHPPVRGRAAIERQYAKAGGPLSLRALAYATEGSIGYIIGGFTRHRGDPDTGKFTLTLRRGEDGRWLIMSDMDNGNSRP